MAKQITQETFDDVVRENMAEFEMPVEDAIVDAVQQFESQGINLTMIIRDPGLYGAAGSTNIHPVIAAIESLSLTTNDGADAAIEATMIKNLQTIQTECDIDLARRCFAGKNKAYSVLLTALKSNPNLLKLTLVALCSLCNGQPDLIDEDGIAVLMDLLRKQRENIDVVEHVVRVIRYNCTKHEMNRVSFVKKGLVPELVKVLAAHQKSPVIVKEVCCVWSVLTLDDDIRVPFGQAHETAKKIVIEGDALKTLLTICKDYTKDISVQSELFSTLSKLVVREEFCTQVMDLGGLNLILMTFQANIAHKGIVRQAISLLTALARSDDVKDAIVKAEGIPLILLSMTHHEANPKIAAAGCQAIATLQLRKPEHCTFVMDNDGHHVILQAMKLHENVEYVQKQGCDAIRNMVARARDNCEAFLELGCEDLIKKARQFKSCDDSAKAALRDLGCQVELKERWTGERGELQH